MQKFYQIAIDGYSSCGKSTLAKALAQSLNFLYIDSGAMYRAVAFYFIRFEINIKNISQVIDHLSKIIIDFTYSEDGIQTILNGENISQKIRGLDIAAMVSEVAAISEVRKKLVAEQRKFSENQSIIMDGRDIGTVVFPHADVKLFITADPLIRAKRRFDELAKKGNTTIDFNQVLENLKHRDHIDSTRADSPLVMAADAILIDNSTFNESQQLELALQIIKKKIN